MCVLHTSTMYNYSSGFENYYIVNFPHNIDKEIERMTKTLNKQRFNVISKITQIIIRDSYD
jgi:hypothetical protein